LIAGGDARRFSRPRQFRHRPAQLRAGHLHPALGISPERKGIFAPQLFFAAAGIFRAARVQRRLKTNFRA
jgi:hypothetical protein